MENKEERNMVGGDIAVYPASEEGQHDLYSADCKCKPSVEVIGAVLLYSHNRLWEIITKEKGSEK